MQLCAVAKMLWVVSRVLLCSCEDVLGDFWNVTVQLQICSWCFFECYCAVVRMLLASNLLLCRCKDVLGGF